MIAILRILSIEGRRSRAGGREHYERRQSSQTEATRAQKSKFRRFESIDPKCPNTFSRDDGRWTVTWDRSLLAAGQFEAANARVPLSVWRWFSSLVVLVDVPERAVVGGIDRHVRVVAPARVHICLHAGAVDDRPSTESHLA